MPDIIENIRYLKSMLPGHIRLVAVSKTKPVSDILIAYNAGQRCFGENRVQEILNKKDLLPADIEWHFIGHLQSNKVKAIIPFTSMIESVDTYKLLSTINSEALKINRVVACLLQIYIADEETKSGFGMNELAEIGDSHGFEDLKNIKICGVMGMATFTSDVNKVQKEFRYLADCFKILGEKYFSASTDYKEISMGMSGDYEAAVREGSTMVRIGSLVFGERMKKNII